MGIIHGLYYGGHKSFPPNNSNANNNNMINNNNTNQWDHFMTCRPTAVGRKGIKDIEASNRLIYCLPTIFWGRWKEKNSLKTMNMTVSPLSPAYTSLDQYFKRPYILTMVSPVRLCHIVGTVVKRTQCERLMR